MVHVEIHALSPDDAAPVWATVAHVRADGEHLDISGEDIVSRDIPIIHPGTGEQVHWSDDPEMWARLLPYAFRAGDLVAVVVEDTSPEALVIEEPTEDDERAPAFSAAGQLGSLLCAGRAVLGAVVRLAASR